MQHTTLARLCPTWIYHLWMTGHTDPLITAPPSDTKEMRAAAVQPSPTVPAWPYLEYDSEGCPRARRPVPRSVLHTQELPPPPRYCQKHKVHRSHSTTIFLIFMGFPFPIQVGGPHTQAAPSMSAVFTHPHGFPHMPEPFSHMFPRLPQSPYACADPHRFSQFPIRFRGSHIQSPGSKNLTLIPTRPALPAPQTRHPWVSTNSLRRLPARYRMSRRNTNPPRPAAGSLKPTRPTDLLKLPAPTGGGAWASGYGVASRCDDAASASTTTWGA